MNIRLAVPLALIGCLLISGPASATIDHQPTDPQPYRFASNVVCVVQADGLRGSGQQVRGAVRQWNAVQAWVRLTMVEEPGCSHLYASLYNADDGLGGFVSFERWVDGSLETGETTWLLPALDIHLNTFRRNPHRCAMRTVAAHEIGHALGLYAHSDGPRSIMNPGVTNWEHLCGMPSATDVRRVRVLYGP